MYESFVWCSRINDIRGQEFELPDMRVDTTRPCTELWYDSTKKENEGEYNTKYNCKFPPTAKTTKYLKINLNENNIN